MLFVKRNLQGENLCMKISNIGVKVNGSDIILVVDPTLWVGEPSYLSEDQSS